MSLVPWRPMREMTRLDDEMLNLFDYFFGPRIRPRAEGVWAPLLDIHEKGENLVVSTDLPGVDPKEVDISVEGRTLSIKGERKGEKEECKEGYCCHERYCGSFQRSITLPDEVDAARTKAAYKDGVLTITMPKSDKAKAKKIKID